MVQAGELPVNSSSEGESCELPFRGQYGGCGKDTGNLPRLGTSTLERKDSKRRSRALESSKHRVLLTV